MDQFRLLLATALVIFAANAPAQPGADSWVPADDEILRIIERRVGQDSDRIGIVVGVIEPQGWRVVAHGSAGGANPQPVNADTVFEIGSVTKVFTSLLLADMVERGELALDDPVANYLPEEVTVPERGGRSIRLVDLATHTSGLPRLDPNMSPQDAANPYADYSIAQLYAFLSSYTLPRDIGAEYEYSNIGVGLLGHALARAAGQDYETLVRTRVTEPLGMSDTAIALSASMQERLAIGHDMKREPVRNWDLPTLAGAGALRSTANDLLAFLAMHLGYETSPLSPAGRAMLEVIRPAGPAGEIALGWHLAPLDETQLVWHNGGTGGYRTYVGYDPEARVGVVALTNMQTTVGVDDIGRHLLDASTPVLPPDSSLLAPPRERIEISLDPALLETYTGRFELAPGVTIAVTRDGTQLSLQLTGQSTVEIYPESETGFFLRVVDAQITFDVGDDGRATALVLHQNGLDLQAERTD